MELEPLFDIDVIGEPIQSIDQINLSVYYMMPQTEAARLLGMSVSNLSKKWRVAAKGRKWPFRSIKKIDEDIRTGKGNVDELRKKRAKLLKPVTIQRVHNTTPTPEPIEYMEAIWS